MFENNFCKLSTLKYFDRIDLFVNSRVEKNTYEATKTPYRTQILKTTIYFNPLPDIPILGSSYSKANIDMMSKIWTNGYRVI